MRVSIALAAVLVVLAAAGYLEGRATPDGDRRSGWPVSYTSSPERGGAGGSAIERLQRSVKMRSGTRKALGAFALSSGRRVELYTADTEDGRSCLLETDPEAGAGAGCLDGGLFRVRRVAFSVSTNGGPEQFDELYVTGVAAPGVRSIELVKTDGTFARLDLNGSRAFVYESPAVDLESRVYPSGFRLFGPNGKLVEAITFPSAGS